MSDLAELLKELKSSHAVFQVVGNATLRRVHREVFKTIQRNTFEAFLQNIEGGNPENRTFVSTKLLKDQLNEYCNLTIWLEVLKLINKILLIMKPFFLLILMPITLFILQAIFDGKCKIMKRLLPAFCFNFLCWKEVFFILLIILTVFIFLIIIIRALGELAKNELSVKLMDYDDGNTEDPFEPIEQSESAEGKINTAIDNLKNPES